MATEPGRDMNIILPPTKYTFDRVYIEGQEPAIAIRLILNVQRVRSGQLAGGPQEFHANVSVETALDLADQMKIAVSEARRRVALGDH